MQTLRALFIICVLVVVTAPLMVLQLLFVLTGARAAKSLPVWWHGFVCRLIGVRVSVEGALAEERPLLIAANHVSWLDINVLSSVAPVSFIAKREVAGWPVFGWLAKLQRSVFVDRERRSATARVNSEIATRLNAGDVMVLFAEGTSSDGNDVLPFRSALLGVAQDLVRGSDADGAEMAAGPVYVQPVALAYIRLNGLPMGRQHRPIVAWHGDIDLGPHLWRLLRAGSIDVTVSFGDPLALTDAGGRKRVARDAERSVRGMAIPTLTGRGNAWAQALPPARQADAGPAGAGTVGTGNVATGHARTALSARPETG